MTINNLLPGPFDTDRLRATDGGAREGRRQDRRRACCRRGATRTPPAASARIDEFGAACAFLCSAHAGFIVGQNLLLDGGAYPGTF